MYGEGGGTAVGGKGEWLEGGGNGGQWGGNAGRGSLVGRRLLGRGSGRMDGGLGTFVV